jgi:hypothetical protein
LVVVLTKKDELNSEAPISFMRTNLQGFELKYLAIDKYAYTIYKSVKHFKSYILKKSHEGHSTTSNGPIFVHSKGDGRKEGKLDGSHSRI